GPLLIGGSRQLKFLDPMTFNELELKWQGQAPEQALDGSPINMAVSANGEIFTALRLIHLGGTWFFRLDGNTVKASYERGSSGLPYPSADGSVIFANGQILEAEGVKLPREERPGQYPSSYYLPAVTGRYFVGVTLKGS